MSLTGVVNIANNKEFDKSVVNSEISLRAAQCDRAVHGDPRVRLGKWELLTTGAPPPRGDGGLDRAPPEASVGLVSSPVPRSGPLLVRFG